MRRLVFLLALGLSAALAQDKPDETLNAVVGVTARIQANARSAETLGSSAAARARWCVRATC